MERKLKRPGGQARGDKSNHCLASINPTWLELKRHVARSIKDATPNRQRQHGYTPQHKSRTFIISPGMGD